MSTADLFVAGFPHGTPAGYDRGCRSGGACPSKVETGQACKDAHVRYQRDPAYRAQVQASEPLEVLAQPEQMTPAPPRTTRQPRFEEPSTSAIAEQRAAMQDRQPTTAPEPLHTVPAALPQPVGTTAPARTPTTPRKTRAPHGEHTLVHGTVYGYTVGCRTVEACPGDADGTTCVAARRAYAADYRRRKRAQLANALAAAAGTTPTNPDTVTVTPSDAGTFTVELPADATAAAKAAFDLATARPLTNSAAADSPARPIHPNSQERLDTLTRGLQPKNATHTTQPTPEGTRRSPQARTPFDGMSGVLAELLQSAWLDGYTTGQDPTE